jgi:lipoic acid synthetase
MLTIGRYQQPGAKHMPMRRYGHSNTIKLYDKVVIKMGAWHSGSCPLVRSSCHAFEQLHVAEVFLMDTLFESQRQ